MKHEDSENRLIEKSVARLEGAVRVASQAVSATIAIMNEAMDVVEAIETGSNKYRRKQ